MAAEKKFIRQMIKILYAGISDMAKFKTDLALNIRSVAEDHRMQRLCMDVRGGIADATIVDIGKVDPEELRKAVDEYNRIHREKVDFFPSTNVMDNSHHYALVNEKDIEVVNQLALEIQRSKQIDHVGMEDLKNDTAIIRLSDDHFDRELVAKKFKKNDNFSIDGLTIGASGKDSYTISFSSGETERLEGLLPYLKTEKDVLSKEQKDRLENILSSEENIPSIRIKQMGDDFTIFYFSSDQEKLQDFLDRAKSSEKQDNIDDIAEDLDLSRDERRMSAPEEEPSLEPEEAEEETEAKKPVEQPVDEREDKGKKKDKKKQKKQQQTQSVPVPPTQTPPVQTQQQPSQQAAPSYQPASQSQEVQPVQVETPAPVIEQKAEESNKFAVYMSPSSDSSHVENTPQPAQQTAQPVSETKTEGQSGSTAITPKAEQQSSPAAATQSRQDQSPVSQAGSDQNQINYFKGSYPEEQKNASQDRSSAQNTITAQNTYVQTSSYAPSVSPSGTDSQGSAYTEKKGTTQNSAYIGSDSNRRLNEAETNLYVGSSAGRTSTAVHISGGSEQSGSSNIDYYKGAGERNTMQTAYSGMTMDASAVKQTNIAMLLADSSGASFTGSVRPVAGNTATGQSNNASGIIASGRSIASHTNFRGFEKTLTAAGGMVTMPLQELWNTEAGQVLRKAAPVKDFAVSMVKTASAVGSLAGIASDWSALFRDNDFKTLIGLLDANATNINDHEFFARIVHRPGSFTEKDLRKLVGKLKALGIDLNTLSRAQVIRLLMDKYGFSRNMAERMYRQLKRLQKLNNKAKLARNMSKAMGQAFISMLMMAINTADDGSLRAVSTSLRIAGTAGKIASVSGRTLLTMAGKDVSRIANSKLGKAAGKGLRKAGSAIKVKTKKTAVKLSNGARNKLQNTKLVKKFKGKKPGFVRTRVSRIRGIKAGRVRITQTSRFSTRLSNIRKVGSKVGRRISKVNKVVSKPFEALSKLVKNLFDFAEWIKRKVILILGAAVLLEVILAAIIGGAFGTISSVIVGFFEFDMDTAEQVYNTDTIIGKVYEELLIDEKNWAQSIFQSGATNDLTNYQYGEQNLDVAEYIQYRYGGAANTLGYQASDSGGYSVQPFTTSYDAARVDIISTTGGASPSVLMQQGTSRTSNLKDILAMTTVFYEQDFELVEYGDTFIERVKSALHTLPTILSNMKKHIKNWFNNLTNNVFHLDLVTSEELRDSEMVFAYAHALFEASHISNFDFECNILPTDLSRTGLDEATADDMVNKALAKTLQQELTICTGYKEHGCCSKAVFYCNDSGDVCDDSGNVLINKWGEKPYMEDSENCAKSPSSHPECWEDTDRDGVKETHNCQGGHTAYYCGGHNVFTAQGLVLCMTEDQINDRVENLDPNLKVPEDGVKMNERVKIMGRDVVWTNGAEGEEPVIPPVAWPIEETLFDIERLRAATYGGDVFDADMCLLHPGMKDDWTGWTLSNIEWAGNLYNQDWMELYNVQIHDEVPIEYFYAGDTSCINAYSTEEIAAIMANYAPGEISPNRAAIIEKAYSLVGQMYYSQLARGRGLGINSCCDCSSFVSLLWNEHYDTFGGGMPTSTVLHDMGDRNYAALKPGDILSKVGHARLFVGMEGDRLIIIESTGINDRNPSKNPNYPRPLLSKPGVRLKTYTLSEMIAQDYRVVHAPD